MINYTLITKPGIIFGNLVTALAGFVLGSNGHFSPLLFVETLFGLGCIIASGCIFNNWMDRDLDKEMKRTQNRPFATGSISSMAALLLAALLLFLGGSSLLLFSNPLATAIALSGFFIYVLLYTPLKKRSLFATAIGSVAGAAPPVVGYVAASGTFDLGALLLFLLLTFWQMPHFYAIAFLHESDYKNARLPMLPFVKGAFRTKLHISCYIVLFFLSLLLLTLFSYTGALFLAVTSTLSLLWFLLSIKGFHAKNNALWGKEMFRFSLVTIGATSLLMVI